MPSRPRFDPKRSLIAARGFTFAGRAYALGDPFPAPDAGPVDERQARRQYEARAVNMGDAPAAPLVQMTALPKHWYEITAPWIDPAIKVRGKANAEKLLAELTEAGRPLGWIAGGTEVTVEPDSEPGWFIVTQPGADPERIEGRDAAERRQHALHEASDADQGDVAAPDGEGAESAPDENPDKSEGESGGDGAPAPIDGQTPATDGEAPAAPVAPLDGASEPPPAPEGN